jgi:alpha-galactosidase
LEKSWAGFNLSSERFGSIGSWPVERYFPTAVFEDREHKTFWAMQICHNASWQMELGRLGDTMSFTGGLGDKDFCGWSKIIKKGEAFKGPKAFVACVEGDIFDACNAVTDMQKVAWEAYGEEGLPIQFNEYCTTWGKPTQKKMLSYLNALKDYDIKDLVIDAGWCKEGHEQSSNGEWNVDKNIFPDIKAMNAEIRKAGKVPGIWFELEVTTSGSPMFEEEYDHMHLKRAGKVVKIKNFRSYWDFRREDVRDYLREKVIDFLKENDFGYIKTDYNSNIGRGVDGGDSDAEALREHLEAVREFFKEIKKEIPDIIIENCAAGGHRLEPSMMGVTALSSFSDAHEAIEIPYVAANLHNLMLPAQSLIWAVLHNDETVERTIYSLAATFLGRVCISGQIDELRPEQYEIIENAIAYYKKLEDIIKNGSSKIYGSRSKSTRYPTGTQVVVRKTDKEMLVICHAFEQPGEEVVLDIPEGFVIKERFYADKIRVENGKLIVDKMDARTAQSVLLSAE